MADQDVGRLRQQLKNLGYLSHGIERWFALDPWSSRTFWAELLWITMKAAAIAAPFAALPFIVVMFFRNGPLPFYDTFLLALIYLLATFAFIGMVVLGTAALLKVRAIAVIERPGRLIWISLAESALVMAMILAWWLAFPAAPRPVEIAVVIGLLLLFLPIGTLAFSAALLSFSIYETQRIPSIHKRSRTLPLTIAGAGMLIFLLVLLPGARPAAGAPEPAQVVIRPSSARIALLAVDGLTADIFEARPTRLAHLIHFAEAPEGSAPEVWATIGTGTPPELHGVRSIDAIRFAGSTRVMQSISRADVLLNNIGAIGLTRRQPLPPTVRERHYVWEVLGARGVDSFAVNWWATTDRHHPPITVVSQESVYQNGSESPPELALSIDRRALALLRGETKSRFSTAYLPALDILRNRLELPDSARLGAVVRALNQLDAAITALNGRQIVVVGTDFVASTIPLHSSAGPRDIAPTILDLFGFPASGEMTGKSLLPGSQQPRILTYGSRLVKTDTRIDSDYYEKLRSLGYVR